MDPQQDPQLGEEIAAVADVCGMDVAEGLVSYYAGERIYIPASLPDGHDLVLRLGLDRAQRLVDHFAGNRLSVPIRLRKPAPAAVILELLGRGLPVRHVARKARCSEDWVYRVVRRAKEEGLSVQDPRQSSLF